jgi:hypothetical protein
MAEAIESSEMMLDCEIEHWAKMTGRDKQEKDVRFRRTIDMDFTAKNLSR